MGILVTNKYEKMSISQQHFHNTEMMLKQVLDSHHSNTIVGFDSITSDNSLKTA